MSRRMPITPMTVPSASRRAEAFRLVEMTSPLALRGFRTTFRSDPPFNHFPQSGGELPRLFRPDEACERLLEHFILPKPEQLRHRVVGLKYLAFEIRNEYRVGSVG